MRLVLDASVAIAAARSTEPSFQAARARVNRVLRGEDHLLVPSIFGIEIAAALARTGQPESHVREYVARLTAASHEVATLGVSRARRVMDVAIEGKLRGADATYVWLASVRRVALCTLDHEMAERARAFCKVIQP